MENFVEDEFQSQSSTGHDQNVSGNQSSTRMKYTDDQIQQFEAFFKKDQYPSDKETLDLGTRLGLENKQVKFWFQDRRNHVKNQAERHENSVLRKENEELLAEKTANEQALKNQACIKCGDPVVHGEISTEEHHLMVDENSKLRDEVNRLSAILAPRSNLPSNTSFVVPTYRPVVDVPRVDKSKLVELAATAMEELIRLAQLEDPMWSRNSQGTEDFLNVEEYKKVFPSLERSNLASQGTRASGNVSIDTLALMEGFFNPAKWIQLFPLTIARGETIDVISAGVQENSDGAMHLMQAEFQVPLPVLPVCQVMFVRFCKKLDNDIWVVVDVSVEAILNSFKCRRLPSGCIVQHMPTGYSKITWIEHMEYDENDIHQAYQPLIRSGMAFGAKKWLTDLQRQCEIYHCAIAMHNATGYTQNGRRSIGKLAMRMMRSFVTCVCSTVQNWKQVGINDMTKFTVRNSIGGEPDGTISSAVTITWIPVLPQRLFEFLQDVNHRVFWDANAQYGPMQKFIQIPKTREPCNDNIALIRGIVPVNDVVIMQDTCMDAFGSYIAHALLNTESISKVLEGHDSDGVNILVSGFAIVPFRHPISTGPNGEGGSTTEYQGVSGSLLTAGLQGLMSSEPNSEPSLEHVKGIKAIMDDTITGIINGVQQVA